MTVRQQKAIQNLPKTNGNVSKAMRMAGYAPSVASAPKVLTESKAYKQYQTEMQALFAKHGITKESYVETIADAMKAEKMGRGGAAAPDHGVRLQANKQAERHLFDDTDQGTGPGQQLEPGDELELTKAVFRKGKNTEDTVLSDQLH